MAAVVRLRYAVNYAIACQDAGFNPRKILRSVDIGERLMKDPEAMISEYQLWRIAGEVANSSGKFDIGFDAGAVCSVQMHGDMRHIYYQKTLFERLIAFCKLSKLEYSRADFFVRPTWNGLVFGRRTIVGEREQVRQVELYVLQLMLETIRSSLGSSWNPTVLSLQSDHHPHLEWLAQSPETRLRFAQPTTEIHIESREAARSVLFNDNADIPNDTEKVSSSVESLIETYVFDPRMSLKFVSRLLGSSDRKLQSDLKRDGTSFSAILSRKRIDAATGMLQDTDLSIFEVSKSLGYSNQAHFTRAYVKKTGMTPSQFRRICQSPEVQG